MARRAGGDECVVDQTVDDVEHTAAATHAQIGEFVRREARFERLEQAHYGGASDIGVGGPDAVSAIDSVPSAATRWLAPAVNR